MSPLETLFLSVLVERSFDNKGTALFAHLPEDVQKALKMLPFTASDLAPLLTPFLTQIERVHYSWLIEPLTHMQSSQRTLLLSFFPKHHQEKLHKHFDAPSLKDLPPPPLRGILLQSLVKEFKWTPPFPKEYLPQNPLSPLLLFEKDALIELIDFLGIYDLAEDIHQIVNKKVLENIYRCISPKKHHFLRECLHKRQKLISPKMHLEQWAGDCKKLSRLLHERGLIRLGNAMSGLPIEFVNTLLFTLDTGRGAVIQENWREEKNKDITPHLVKQTLNLLKFLTNNISQLNYKGNQ